MTAESSSGISLESQLKDACRDLWWSSESDYPIEVVWCSLSDRSLSDRSLSDRSLSDSSVSDIDDYLGGQETPTLLHQVIDVDSDKTLSVIDDVEGFFARSLTPQSWHTAEDKAQLTQLQQLKTLLSASLTQLKVYRYGEIEVLIYILGRTSEGNIAGVKTCSIET